MEPLTGIETVTQLYESCAFPLRRQRHSITGSPIIVKCKSVPAPFRLLGSPQQDWGHGSLPCRNLIIWSGRVDLNHRFLPSEGRGSTRLSYALICLAQNDPVMLIHDHGAPCAFRRGALERATGVAPVRAAWKAVMLLLHQARIISLTIVIIPVTGLLRIAGPCPTDRRY